MSGSLASGPVASGDGAARLDRRFAVLWTSSTASAFGTGLATVATPLFVASQTSDPLLVSSAAAVTWLPWLLFALPGGVLVDRVDRRRLMVLIDCLRAVAMVGLVAAVLLHTAALAVLLVVLFLVSTGEVIERSAGQALLPALVPLDRLERANGWLFGGAMVGQQMVAGPLGGFLFAVAAAAPFVVNAATFVVSAGVLALLAGSFRAASVSAGPPIARSVRREVLDGLRWLAHQRLLRTMALLIGLLNVTLTAALAVLVLLARDRLGLGSVGYGLLFTALAVGGLLGALVGDRLIARVTATWTIRVGLLIEAGTHLVLATSRGAAVVGVALFLFGVHGSLWGIVANSLRQRLAPPEMLGRVTSSTLFVSAGGNCLGAVLGGGLASAFGLTAPYWVGFVVAALVAAVTWRVFDRATVRTAYADPVSTA